MRYKIYYSCTCHNGNVRSINQDNFICDSQYMEACEGNAVTHLCGVKSSKEGALFGVFDGMGGEECGEVASYLAAKNSGSLKIVKDPADTLLNFCHTVNTEICSYVTENALISMGTTAAMLAFSNKGITLCNIGDSKIFRFRSGIFEQLSEDHVVFAAFGVKPPLSQNLGIPPSELEIDPYLARGTYKNGDCYLICSDGLTDMLTNEEIIDILAAEPTVEKANEELLEKALKNGGRDNITIILCKIERDLGWVSSFKSLFQRKEV